MCMVTVKRLILYLILFLLSPVLIAGMIFVAPITGLVMAYIWATDYRGNILSIGMVACASAIMYLGALLYFLRMIE